MARPQKNKIEYFPHVVTHSKKMSYMEKKYNNDGYAVWFKILEELGNTDFHYLDLSDEIQVMFLSDKCLVSEERLLEIIKDLVKLKEFDVELWSENKILFSSKFVESIKDAYAKRTNDCVDRNSILLLLDSLGIRKLNKSSNKPSKSSSDGVVKPQTKLEETKEKRTIDFDLFWSKYPTKKSKKDCLKKFTNLKQFEVDLILETIDAFVKYKPFESYNHPNPLTYLNQERWNDEIQSNDKPKINNPNNEKMITFTSNANPSRQQLPESEFLDFKERMQGGGYIFKIIA